MPRYRGGSTQGQRNRMRQRTTPPPDRQIDGCPSEHLISPIETRDPQFKPWREGPPIDDVIWSIGRHLQPPTLAPATRQIFNIAGDRLTPEGGWIVEDRRG